MAEVKKKDSCVGYTDNKWSGIVPVLKLYEPVFLSLSYLHQQWLILFHLPSPPPSFSPNIKLRILFLGAQFSQHIALEIYYKVSSWEGVLLTIWGTHQKVKVDEVWLIVIQADLEYDLLMEGMWL